MQGVNEVPAAYSGGNATFATSIFGASQPSGNEPFGTLDGNFSDWSATGLGATYPLSNEPFGTVPNYYDRKTITLGTGSIDPFGPANAAINRYQSGLEDLHQRLLFVESATIGSRWPAVGGAQRPPTFDKNPNKRPFPQRIRNEWEIIRERPRGRGKQYEVSENGRKLGWFPGTLLKGSEMLLQWEEAQSVSGWDAEVFLLRLVPYDWPDALAQSILREAAAYFVHVDMFLEWRLLHDLERPDFGIEDGGAGTDKKSQNLVVPVPLLTKLEASKAAIDERRQMQVTFNGWERTLREIVALAFWKLSATSSQCRSHYPCCRGSAFFDVRWGGRRGSCSGVADARHDGKCVCGHGAPIITNMWTDEQRTCIHLAWWSHRVAQRKSAVAPVAASQTL
ncbi:hypothetical protein B0H14DRAFT_3128507 [Mycena olivaceomarginata]|nr:hypothetical protein B0H14DRAFT_3128507 [Mycena olivaceomarginata]